ncbi:MAG: apolipoprotein N-acyltransferase [Candidatus Rokubacteria bacterium GWC2_70_16]|nr:MAG: apolipoprotein N-acyltransferase [Candidatus Rokubacteria bacterium GWC2_70_16]OGL18053.1 MAG: apolipoprotein N-acyltransferase [Candidatus Rokubacteria bacterium RIFCSPLOWO2_12_FULL_71_19]
MDPDRLAPLSRAGLRLPLLLTAGVAGALAFPAADWWLFGWVWVAPALACALVRPPRAALGDGWLQGTVFFVVLLRWLDHTFRHYSAIPWPLTWLPILALAAYCGLYAGLVCAAVARLRARVGAGWAAAMAPALWVGGEWIRGRLMDGFPWGLAGYSQHAVLPVIQIAELTGVYGVSFLLLAVNAALAAAVGLGWRRALPGALVTLALVGGALGFGWSALRADGPGATRAGPSVRVGLIQPSIEQTMKWDPVRHAEIMSVYERLTREAARPEAAGGASAPPAIVLWPETAATIFLRGDPALLGRLAALSAELGSALLVGSIDRLDGPRGKLLNSAFFLDGRGIGAKYDKIHLVPFGEYVPLSGLIGFVRSWAEFISDFGAGQERTLFPLPGAPFGVVICYEVIFPELFRGFVAEGATFMVNITNDAWFGETSGPWQHLGMLPLRAVENRVAIARAANTGVSAFVAPSGRVTRRLPLLERGVLADRVPLRQTATVYTRFGDWFALACLAVAAGALGHSLFRRSTPSC